MIGAKTDSSTHFFSFNLCVIGREGEFCNMKKRGSWENDERYLLRVEEKEKDTTTQYMAPFIFQFLLW